MHSDWFHGGESSLRIRAIIQDATLTLWRRTCGVELALQPFTRLTSRTAVPRVITSADWIWRITLRISNAVITCNRWRVKEEARRASALGWRIKIDKLNISPAYRQNLYLETKGVRVENSSYEFFLRINRWPNVPSAFRPWRWSRRNQAARRLLRGLDEKQFRCSRWSPYRTKLVTEHPTSRVSRSAPRLYEGISEDIDQISY